MVQGKWAQELQLVVKVVEEYEDKSEALDILWILQELKKFTVGVDAKVNNLNTLYD